MLLRPRRAALRLKDAANFHRQLFVGKCLAILSVASRSRGAHVRGARLSNVLGFEWSETEKEKHMLALAIAMGTVVWAMIGYALFSPNPPAPEGAE